MRVHFLTLSYTPGSIRCASRVSLLSRLLVSLCLGREPKVRVATHLPSVKTNDFHKFLYVGFDNYKKNSKYFKFTLILIIVVRVYDIYH